MWCVRPTNSEVGPWDTGCGDDIRNGSYTDDPHDSSGGGNDDGDKDVGKESAEPVTVHLNQADGGLMIPP